MLTVKDALKTAGLADAVVIAGESGLENKISFVTVMDVPMIAKWLHGGEMLLAAALFEHNCSEAFFRDLKRKSVAAVVTKPAFAQRMTPELASLCDEMGLPIVVASAKISWGDVMNPIMELVAKSHHDETYRSQQFHLVLMNSLVNGEPLGALCDKVHDAAGLAICILDAELRLEGSTSSFPWAKALKGFSLEAAEPQTSMTTLNDAKQPRGYRYANPFLAQRKKHALVFPVVQNEVTYGYVLMLAHEHMSRVLPDENVMLEQLGLMVALHEMRKHEIRNIEQRYNNLLLDRVFYESSPSEQKKLLASQTKDWRIHDSYYIVLVQLDGEDDDPVLHNRRTLRLFESLRADRATFRDILCFERGGNLVFFVPGEAGNLASTLSLLGERCLRGLRAEDLHIGVSSLVTNGDYYTAHSQAQQALRYETAYPGPTRCCYYDRLGILRLFMDKQGNVNMDFLMELHRRCLGPLRDYDRRAGTSLERTLALFVQSNQSHKETCEALHIHRNTLYSRLEKIEKLLGFSLDSSDDVLNIQLALKIDFFIDQS